MWGVKWFVFAVLVDCFCVWFVTNLLVFVFNAKVSGNRYEKAIEAKKFNRRHM